MIVFACGISHESHSFSSRLTYLSDFAGAVPGSIDIDPALATTRSTEDGIICAASERNWDLRFSFSASATPSGPLTATTFETLADSLIAELKKQGKVDGILLALHGAIIAENCPDCEGEILERVRSVVGPDLPIALSLDLHANFTERMARFANIATSYRTTPHVDQWETSHRAACMLDDAMHGRTHPRVYVSRLPMLSGMDMGRTIDPDGPMSCLLRDARKIENEDTDVLDITLNAGYYYGDVFEAGPSVTVTGNGEDPKFSAIGAQLMRAAWETKDYVSIKHVSVIEAIARAHAVPQARGPIILVDYTDGPMGGANGDGTRLLSALIAENLPDTVVGPIFDPLAAERATEAGVGAAVSLWVGGIGDQEFSGPPVLVSGLVVSVSDGDYVRKGPYASGTIGHFGKSARLQCGNVSIIIVSLRVQPEDREQYRIFGIDPEDVNILACKGINHFRADFEPIARELVFVDSGGIVSVDFTRFAFKNVRRPIWPLDPDVKLP